MMELGGEEARELSPGGTSQDHADLPAHVLEALVEIGSELQGEEAHFDRVLTLATSNAGDLLETDLAWLALLEEPAGLVHVVRARGASIPEFGEMEVRLGEGLGGTALERRRTLVIDDYAGWAEPGPVRETMLREGVRSVVCAPMLHGSARVGALYVANRNTTPFQGRLASTVTALASQASVAIDNARLLSKLLDKTRMLESTFDIHRRLDASAIAEHSIESVTMELAELVGRPLRLEQDIVTPFGCRAQPPGVELDGVIATVMPLVAADGLLGRVTVYGRRPLTELETNALAHGATVLSLALMRYRSAHEVEWRLRGDLLDELLAGTSVDAAVISARTQRLGIDLSLPHRLLVVHAQDGTRKELARVVSEVTGYPEGTASVPHRRILSTWHGRRKIIAAVGDNDVRGLAEAVVGDPRLAHRSVAVGISDPDTDFRRTLRQAMACCSIAASTTGSRVLEHGQLGPLRFMLDGGRLDHASAHVAELLGQIAAHDRTSGGQLLETLRAFVEEDGHHPRIAERCHIHPSTVKYRLARLSELIENPLREPRSKFEIALAFQLLDVLRALGIDPLT